MDKKVFNKAQRLYETIHQYQCDIKDIKQYEQKHFKSGVPLTLKVPYTTGSFGVASDIIIADKELIKEVLNIIKIHSVKTIQNAEKELEDL